MHFALTTAWTPGGDVAYALGLSDRTVWEIFVGPGTFAAFAPDEAAHMRDVRVVFWGFMAVAIASIGLISWQVARHPRDSRVWRSIARGGMVTVVALVVVGVFAAVAFDAAFTLFHEIFFPGGNWAFPADSLLIRLYPYAFWELSAAALGILGVGSGLVVWFLARRRADRLAEPPASGGAAA
jgi:integral membrane protein (TIGR01906 family)